MLVWIQGLPLEFDVIEAPKTHELLCQLISTYGWIKTRVDRVYLNLSANRELQWFCLLVRRLFRFVSCRVSCVRYGADVMGPDWCNFPLILNVFGQILQSPKKTELITQETLALLKHLLHALPLELLLKGRIEWRVAIMRSVEELNRIRLTKRIGLRQIRIRPQSDYDVFHRWLTSRHICPRRVSPKGAENFPWHGLNYRVAEPEKVFAEINLVCRVLIV